MSVFTVSVCVCHKSVFYRNDWNDRARFWYGGFLRSILQCVVREFGYLKIRLLVPCRTLSRTSGLRKIRHCMSTVVRVVNESSSRLELHYFNLLWKCCTISCATNPQEIETVLAQPSLPYIHHAHSLLHLCRSWQRTSHARQLSLYAEGTAHI